MGILSGDDNFNGGKGDDTILGCEGDDKLFGNNNDDTLTGGPGADEFECGNGEDTITDYTPSEGDTIVDPENCENITTNESPTLVGPEGTVTCGEGDFEVSGEFAGAGASIVVHVGTNSGPIVGTATADANGVWSTTIDPKDTNLGDGTFTLIATANGIDTNTIQVTIDCPPTLVGPEGTVTCGEGDFEVSGEFAGAGASIVVHVGTNSGPIVGTATADANGVWSTTIDPKDTNLGDGTFTLIATANGIDTNTIQVTIDCPPTLVGPEGTVTCGEGDFEVSGEFAGAGASIVVHVGTNSGPIVGTATADANGVWSTTIDPKDTNLGDGTFTLIATANGIDTNTIQVTIDCPPTLVGPEGTVTCGEGDFEVSGEFAGAGASIVVHVGTNSGPIVGTATADANGVWSTTIDPKDTNLGDGTFTLIATANGIDTNTIQVTIDCPPTLVGPEGTVTCGEGDFEVSGEFAGAGASIVVHVGTNSGPIVGTATADANGVWSTTIDPKDTNLGDGTFTLIATANGIDTNTIQVTIDCPPTLVGPEGTVTCGEGDFEVSGEFAGAGASIVVHVGTNSGPIVGTATADANGVWSTTIDPKDPNLGDGTFTLIVTANGIDTNTIQVTIDCPPTLVGPEGTVTCGEGDFEVSGEFAGAGASIVVHVGTNSGPIVGTATADANGVWSTTIDPKDPNLGDGTFTLIATANGIDTNTIQVTIDCPPTLVGPEGTVTCGEGDFEVSGEFAGAGASIVVHVGTNSGPIVGTATADANGVWSTTIDPKDPNLGDGTFTLIATANGIDTNTIQVTIDCPPTLVGPEGTVTCGEGDFEVSGEFAGAGASIVVYVVDDQDQRHEIGTATADANGVWSTTIDPKDPNLGDGTFTLIADSKWY